MSSRRIDPSGKIEFLENTCTHGSNIGSLSHIKNLIGAPIDVHRCPSFSHMKSITIDSSKMKRIRFLKTNICQKNAFLSKIAISFDMFATLPQILKQGRSVD